jgi:hypothetical protein
MSIPTDNLINDVTNLHKIADNKYRISDESLSEIITPEWYYSDSKRIFENLTISWESLLESDLINNISLDVKLFTISRRDIIFEKSFCTWYQPYHLLPQTRWGIHIRFSSWMKFTSQLNTEDPNLKSKLNNSVVASFLYVYLHGIFHYIIENVISTIELSTKNPIFYNDYYMNNYLQTFNTLECLEESLANAYLYENASECHIDQEYLQSVLVNQGSAYANFLNYTATNFLKGCMKLIFQIKDKHNKDLSNYNFKDLEHFFDLKSSNSILKNQIPIWLHHKPKPIH